MHRFFVPKKWIIQDKVRLKGEPAHQIYKVLRLKPKEHILVLDNTGWEYEVEIEKVVGELVEARVVRKALCPTEPKIRITLYQALLKADKFEFVVQKGVELGVSAFVPFTCERCVIKKLGESKIKRWERIIQEAAEQSRRALVPTLHPVTSFKEACEIAGTPSILLWEEERSTSLAKVLKNQPFQSSQALNIFIGPEGGFLASEVEYAQSKGIVVTGLGCRILRAETAGLAVVSAILYDRGEFG